MAEQPYETFHEEEHYINRAGWLRAAVLGANDGIVSVSALIVGVAAAEPSPRAIMLAGAAGLVAGAMSMAAGEYVSVSSQADMENADIARERDALRNVPDEEEAELAAILMQRGMTRNTAIRAAEEMTRHNALEAHKREELGLSEDNAAKPLQAAGTSALSFSTAAAIPVAAAALAPAAHVILTVVIVTLICLAALGAVGARTGGAPMLPAMLRVLFWGAAAMAITALIGNIFGISA